MYEERKPSYGIIIGRFQVDTLHDGHKELFRQVKSLHHRVFVFLGVSAFSFTQRNPLDFLSRKQMIENAFPDVTCLALPDMRTDEAWSKELDTRIDEVCKFGHRVLYGSRDAFINRYSGKNACVPLVLNCSPDVSSTHVRQVISDTVRDSADFRAGMIHAVTNRFPQVMSTVDIAIMNSTLENTCLVHKTVDVTPAGQVLWRFPGGFVDPRKDKSRKRAAVREAFEETGLEVHSPEYINSFPVPDWRLIGEDDEIITDFFIGQNDSGVCHSRDDVSIAKWFPVAGVASSMIVHEHHMLLDALVTYIQDINNQGE
jgi:bifunctional NMN adenylyltransferase/nudix hydrolase